MFAIYLFKMHEYVKIKRKTDISESDKIEIKSTVDRKDIETDKPDTIEKEELSKYDKQPYEQILKNISLHQQKQYHEIITENSINKTFESQDECDLELFMQIKI